MHSALFSDFKGFLILGRFLGVVPIAGAFERSYKHLRYSFYSHATLSSLLCILLISFSMGVAIIDMIGVQTRNATEIANSIGGPIFFGWGLFMYSYFLCRRQSFLKIFDSWVRCVARLNYTREDKTLRCTIILVSVVVFTSAILENAVSHMDYFVVFDDINGHTKKYGVDPNRNVSALQMYYWRAHYNWNQYFGNYPLLAIPAFLSNKVVLYGGNYVDVMMSLFARALYFKFHMLNEVSSASLLQPMPSLGKTDLQLDHNGWTLLAKDHDSLCALLNDMNAFFSPVIFVSFTVNMYFFCMQLLHTLNPDFSDNSIVHSIYSKWSFVHIIVRIFILSLYMARVNECAHKTREIVNKCPTKLTSSGHIARLEKRVNAGPTLGFNGFGCFTVTKPFMLSIINVVFTIEIVLLQGLSVNQKSIDLHNNCP